MSNPKITVLMPVYNGEKYLKESIESILNQTFSDFEFLIVDDGSTDKSVQIIEEYQKKDLRIRLLDNQKEKGIVGALNTGLEQTRGKYIARMDCDDISLPERLSKQFEFMEKNREVGVCGSWIRLFGKTEGMVKNPSGHNTIKCHLLFYNAVAHPTAMMRAEFFKKFSLKYKNFSHAEDFELWARCSFLFKLYNIPEVLLNYRISEDNITSRKKDVLFNTVLNIFRNSLGRLTIQTPDDILALHKLIGDKAVLSQKKEIKRAGVHLFNLWIKNRHYSVYPRKEFRKMLINLWITSCLKSNIGIIQKMYYLVFPIGLMMRMRKNSN